MRCLTLLLVVGAATTAQSAQANAQSVPAAIQAACAEDARELCAGVQPGGGRILACLKEHKDALSDRCKQAAGLPVSPSGSTPANATVPPSTGANAPGGKARAPVAKPDSSGADADAVKFVEHIIADTQHNGMRAATIHVPENWTFDGKIEWHYNWVEYPASYSSHAENPANAEAFFQYPHLRLERTEVPPQLRQYDKGRKVAPGERLPTGALSMAPLPAFQALALFIQKTRPGVANLKWVGKQDLPDLAKEVRLAALPNQHGVAIKISYDLNGQPVEEAFFGVYYISQGANAGVNAGMIKQTNWGLQALTSFRAPAGTLDKQMPMFCVITKSLYINPQWARLSKAITNQMEAAFEQKLKQGYDQLAAAQRIMEQTMQQQAAFQANFDKQEEAFRSSGGVDTSYLRDGGARSASDHWSDLIRGVDTLNDPSTGGTIQLSNLGAYHFTDGFGNYRTYDDPNATPEKAGEVGSWTPMTASP